MIAKCGRERSFKLTSWLNSLDLTHFQHSVDDTLLRDTVLVTQHKCHEVSNTESVFLRHNLPAGFDLTNVNSSTQHDRQTQTLQWSQVYEGENADYNNIYILNLCLQSSALRRWSFKFDHCYTVGLHIYRIINGSIISTDNSTESVHFTFSTVLILI